MNYLYLIIDLASLSFPLAFTAIAKTFQWKNISKVLIGSILVAIPFLIWDIWFTEVGAWGFNETYHLPITFFGLPFEEYLFFLVIPYSSLFIHYILHERISNLRLTELATKLISAGLLLIACVLILTSFHKIYTLVNLSLFIIVILWGILREIDILAKFYISFVLIIIPFLVVNGVLTGSMIQDPIVWYSDTAIFGLRIFTIPVEDVFYAFNLLFLNLLIINKLTSSETKVSIHSV